uniref:peptidylprolyl isomerase n=1 Tax=Phaeomonas parva TaxID=124430 RepID=A0A6U4EQX5_9STRA|mmetsp:Transcript_22035/g.67651  ORF Transcript_22035/g.67651 Transcript_22035/m.67651 type:complete len:216 (+) Transcript_22035:120-767(+)
MRFLLAALLALPAAAMVQRGASNPKPKAMLPRRDFAAGLGLSLLGLGLGLDPKSAQAASIETQEFRGMQSMDVPEVGAFRKVNPGLAVADVKVGDGSEVKVGDVVTAQWVLRRANGYFIDASVGAPVQSAGRADPLIFKVGSDKAIAGFNEGLVGMKVGGVRRLLVGPSQGYVDGVGDGKPGPMPAGFGPRRQIEVRRTTETFFFEVQVTKSRQG